MNNPEWMEDFIEAGFAELSDYLSNHLAFSIYWENYAETDTED